MVQVGRSGESGPHDAVGIERRVEIPGSTGVELPPGTAWRIALEADGLWSPGETVLAGATRTVSLLVWPTGTIEGSVVSEVGGEVPGSLTVRFASPLGPQAWGDPQEQSVRCPVSDGRFECSLPAGKLDLSVRAEGHIAHYFWDLTVAPGTRTSIGELRLRRGASIVGWVEVPDQPDAASGTTVTAVPFQAREAPESTGQAHLAERSTTSSDRGFFQLLDLGPGVYQISATREGYATARRLPVTVYEGSEVELREPLSLQRPGVLEVYVDPPWDPRGEGGPWQLDLLARDRVSRVSQHLAGGPATESGWWKAEGISPGPYWLTVRGTAGDTWYSDQVELDGESRTLFIDLDLIEVEGEVSLGKEPLSAKLRFSSGRLGETIAFDSDRYGRFTGMLPGEGAYRVRVNAVAPAVARDLTGVQVESSGPGEGRVRIRLPATRVRGAVVDEQGKPIEGAWVQAESIAEPEVPTSSPATAKDGSFEFEGLPPGPLRLMAEAPDGRTSPWALTILQETRLPPEIRLVVRDVVSVRGRIVADELGIPGAAVYVSPANQPVGVGQRVVTDVAGRFQAQLPKRAGGALITVSAPGFARRALRFRELPQEPLSIQVERYGGQLVLQVDAPPGPEDWAQPQVVVFKDGVPSPLPALASWAQMNGLRQETDDLLVVPLLEAGTYTACRMWLAEIERTDEAALPGPRCASGFLPPLGELRLRVPLMREGSTSPPADTRFR